MSLNSEHFKQNPDILKSYGSLLADASNLIEQIDLAQAEITQNQETSHAFIFPLIEDNDIAVPKRVTDLIGELSHLTISFDTSPDSDNFASLSVDFFSKGVMYHTSRDSHSSNPFQPEEKNDAIVDLKNDTEPRYVPAMTTAELNSLIFSIILPDSNPATLDPDHFSKDLATVNSTASLAAIFTLMK